VTGLWLERKVSQLAIHGAGMARFDHYNEEQFLRPASLCPFCSHSEFPSRMNEPDPADVLAHHVLVDAAGLACPLPLLKAKQALNRMHSGEVLQVVATDAGSFRDFQVFAQQSGHPLLRAIDNGDSYQYWIRKK